MKRIDLDSLSPADLDAWGRLAERAAEPNPFFEALLVPAAARALGVEGVSLLVAETDAGEWAGALPIVERRVARVVRLLEAWRHPYSYLGTPLADRDRLDEFSGALATSLAAGDHGRHLMIRRFSVGPVLEAVRAAADESGVEVLFERRAERGAYRGRDPEHPLDWIKSKRRSELRRQRRKLGEQLGADVGVRDRPDIESAVAIFLSLEASGWKGAGGSALASGQGSTRLFEEMTTAFAAAGRLQIRALEAGDRTVAMTCDLVAGDTLFGFKTAYDETLRSFSPGVQLQAENFGFFDRERHETFFDSCAEADSEMVNGLWPDRRPIATLVLGPGGFRGAASRWALERTYSASQRGN